MFKSHGKLPTAVRMLGRIGQARNKVTHQAFEPFDFLRATMDTWVNGHTHPGAIVGMFDKNGKEMFYHESVSPRANMKAAGPPFQRDSIFRLYSLSKPLAATAAMILVERGLLSLDDEVTKWLPAFKNTQVYVRGDGDSMVTEPIKSPITIRHLMSHTSGLVYAVTGKTTPERILLNRLGCGIATALMTKPIEEMCNIFASVPLLFQPGTKFAYGVSVDVLGHIMELITGKRLDEFYREEVLGPLGMVDTEFWVPPEKAHRLAKLYRMTPSMSYTEVPPPPPAESFLKPMLSPTAGGGLLSTLHDYSRFTTCLLNKGAIVGTNRRLLSEASVALMTTNALPMGRDMHEVAAVPGSLEWDGDRGFGFGLSFYVLTDPSVAQGGALSAEGEFGWGGLASTAFMVSPKAGMSLVLMTQLLPGNAYPIRSHLRYMSHWALEEMQRRKLLVENQQHTSVDVGTKGQHMRA